MEINIDMTTLEKLNNFITENVDSKYKGIVDPKGIDSLKKEISKHPELKKFFNIECSDKKEV